MSDTAAQPQIIPPCAVYCTRCKWAIRANWVAQELFQSFSPSEITQITLQPNEEVYANEKLLWDRKTQGRFPEITELKRTVRDELVPEKNLGHADK